MKRFIPFLSIILSGFCAFSQSATTSIALSKVGFRNQTLTQNFKNYEVYELPEVSGIYDNTLNLKLNFGGDVSLSLEISRNTIFDRNSKVIVSTPTGEEQVEVNPPLTYSGREEGTTNPCALTLNADMFCGFIQNNADVIYWEPLFRFIPDAPKNLILYYHADDVVPNENFKCLVTDSQKLQNDAHENIESDSESLMTGCYEIEFAQAADYSMWQKYGGATGLTNYLASVMNLVQTNYDDEFNVSLIFKVTGSWFSSCPSCDPWTTSTDIEALLNSFSNWGNTNMNFTQIPHDLGILWSNRDFNGSVVGYAFWGVACWNGYKYSVAQDFSSDIQLIRQTVSHEVGHNLNAAHDGVNNLMMSPIGSNTNTWSQQSKNTINAYVQTKIDDGCFTSNSNATFSFNVNNLTVGFTSNSSNATAYLWDFGDNQTSTQANPTHTYASPGNYNVCLTVTGTCGSSTSCQTVSIAYDYCWHWQNPLAQGNYLEDIFFINVQTGWIVGAGGTILKTTNNGITWQRQNSGTTNWLNAVSFLDTQSGWAVGNGGTILKTNNGGSTWQSQNSGTTNSFNGVQFIDSQRGWAVGTGGIILKTSDGGANWQNQSSGTGETLWDIQFADSQLGWAVGSGGVILNTINGGANWQNQSSGTTNRLYGVHFENSQSGWAVGNSGKILKTNNGGSTWESQNSGSSETRLGVHFIDDQTGWAVGFSGGIVSTNDGGTTWQSQSSGVSNSLSSVYFIDNQTGWAVGYGGSILKTNNGGATWQNQTSGTRKYLNGVHFENSQIGWAVGDDESILKTVNGGSTWESQYSGIIPEYYKIYFVDTQSGWAIGDGTIKKTINGGSTWQNQNPGIFNYFRGLHFIDDQTGWVVGFGGAILKTSNGGATWQNLPSGTVNKLFDVYFVDSQTGWAVGDHYTILKTNNGGSTWQQLASPANYEVFDVHFVDSQIGWVVGSYGQIMKTINGGTNWQVQSSGTQSFLRGVFFVNNQTGWAVGDGGTILYTSNGGITWQSQVSGSSTSFNGVYFVDSQNGWAVGQDGTILKFGKAQPPAIQNLTVCKNTPVNPLTATGTNLLWYTTAFGGTGSTTAPTPNTSITGTTTYYVSQSPIGVGNCTESERAAISVTVTAPAATISTTNSCNNNGTATITATGSDLPYSYLWSNGQTSSMITNLTSGTYTVTLTNANGCSSTLSASVSSGLTTSANFGFSSSGLSVTFSNTSSNATSYFWNFGNGQTSTAINPTFTYSTSGTYNVCLTATGDCGSVQSCQTITVLLPNDACWQSQPSGTTNWLRGVHFWDSLNGIAVGAGGIVLKTINGGATWQSQNSGTTIWLLGIYFVDNQLGWAVGSNGLILKTNNGGVTWQSQPSGTNKQLEGVHFIDSQTGWIIGEGGTILKTNNGGASWQSQNSGITTHLYEVQFIDSQTGWAVGNNGVILKTNNGGASWQSQSSGTNKWLRGVHFINSQTGWTVGELGTILKTNDSGISWQSQPSGTTNWLWVVHFVDSQTGWTAGGSGGGLYKTTNGGATWQSQNSGTTNILYDIQFIDSQTGWVVGDNGTILKFGEILPPTVQNITLCKDAPSQPLTATGTNLLWYATSTGGTGSTTAPMPNTSMVGTFTYYVSQSPGVSGVCGESQRVPLVVNVTQPSISMTYTSGCPSGTAEVTVINGGAGAFTYTWSNGQTSSINTNVPPGAFGVTVTDSNGCQVSQVQVMSQGMPPLANVSSMVSPCIGQSNGSATVTASGGVAPYTYIWSNGQTGATANNLIAGNYFVTVTGNNGCSSSATATVSTAAAPTASISSTVSPCVGQSNGSATVTASGGVAPYTYIWSNGQTGATANNLIAGNYFVTVTGNNGCSSTATVTVSSAAAPTASISGTVSPCVGQSNGSATVTASGGVAPYTYIWSNGQTGAIANNLIAGNYFVTVTGNNGCTGNSTAILVDVPVFNIDLSTNLEPSGQACHSSAVPQSGISPFTYYWSNGQTTQTASGLPSGQLFSVTVTDASGCISSQSGSCMPVSTNEIEGIEFYSVKPNPANSYLSIQIRLRQPENLRIRFFNSIGQQLYESSFNSTDIDEVIDLNQYPTGCYFIQFTTRNGSKSEIITIAR